MMLLLRYTLLTLLVVFVFACVLDKSFADANQEDATGHCPHAISFPKEDGLDKVSTFEEMNRLKACYVDYNIDWYSRHAFRYNMLFRTLGVVIVVGSIFVPILNNIDSVKRYVNIVSIIVAICASLSGFFSWRENWAAFRAAQFQLEYLERVWQLEMVEANRLEGEAASTKALEATRRLVEGAFNVVSKETGGFFERVPAPKSS
jgi:uncharacterized protein DUF4231